MKTAGIIGASGYTGHMLLELLRAHPEVELRVLNSRHYAGQKVGSLYSAFEDDLSYTGYSLEEIAATNLDIIFLALPHAQSMDAVQILDRSSAKLIDMSADYRFQDPRVYARVYGREPLETRRKWVYGLTELFKQDIQTADAVANPGCYATAAILAAYPLKDQLERAIFDCVSGWSGAGRDSVYAKQQKLLEDNIIAYNLARHRHKYEIEQYISGGVSFTPHIFDAVEGIMCTAHLLLKPGVDIGGDWKQYYQAWYKDAAFVRVRDNIPDIRTTTGTNFCDIGGFEVDEAGQLVVVATLDNLMKGAASQAVQNMNLMLGLAEGTGLSSSVTLRV